MATTLHPDQQTRPAGEDLPHSPTLPFSPSPALLPLAAILLLALALRLSGLNWGLPWAFHPDEIFYVDQAQDMLKFGDPNPKYFKNPSLLTYLIAAELNLTRLLGPLAGPFAPSEPGATYLLARLDSALLGTASVGLLHAIGAALLNRRVALLAALLLAVTFLHVRDSHYGVNDVPSTFLLLLSFYFDVRLLRDPKLRWYLLAGLFGGLATSTKYNMGFFFVPLVTAHVLAHWEQGKKAVILPLFAAGAASLLGYLAGTPYTLLDFRRWWPDFLTQYRYGDYRWLGQPLEPVPWLYLTSLLQGFGAVPLLLAVVGLALLWRARRKEAILLVSFPLVYLAFLMPKQLFFPRFTIPLLPLFCLLAAYGALELAQRLPAARRRLGSIALLAIALVQPLTNDLLHNRLLLTPDTRVVANEWIQANLPPGSRLKVEDYSLRDLSTASRTYTPNTADLRIERFEGSPEAEQASYFAQRNVQYVVTSSFAFERYLLDPPREEQRENGVRYGRLHQSLDRRAELVVTFAPGHGNRPVPYRLDDVMTPFWSLEQYERPGPTVRVYSVAALAGGS